MTNNNNINNSNNDDNEPNNNNNNNDTQGRAAASPNPARQGDNVLTVAQLRRSSSHVTPTRTLRLSEQEHQQQEQQSSPISLRRVTLESLQGRPRSNQRNRTPNRHESPLDPEAFRRRRNENSEDDGNNAGGARRITIRPGAGAAVGAVPVRIREERANVVSAETLLLSSSKQGPSHRKVRRWNNDHLDRMAAEIAPSSQKAANALLKGHEEAHLYRNVVVEHHEESGWNRFLQDDSLQSVRSRFFDGEGPDPAAAQDQPRKPSSAKVILTGEDRLRRIDPRLRRVVTKACQNSYPACRVVKTLETFVLETFFGGGAASTVSSSSSSLEPDWWKDVLLECPTVTTHDEDNESSTTTAQFYFDPIKATGGFHRLLLHAICQFHGLKVLSRMVSNAVDGGCKARALTVTGVVVVSDRQNQQDTTQQLSLLEVLTAGDETGATNVETCRSKIEDTWTVV